MKIGIVGLGLIGGSIARGLIGKDHTVVAFDVDAESCASATRDGIAPAASIAALCASEPDVIIVAVPLRTMSETFTEIAHHLVAGTIVTDVGSVKQPISELVHSLGLDHAYVGAHPMAGTERAGFDASSADLLLAAPWALTLTAVTPRIPFMRVLHLICRDLRGRVIPLAPEVHDASVALTSHLPHVAANGLLNVVHSSPFAETAFALAAGSFRDGTRVGGTQPRRTEAMVVDNADWVVPGLRTYAAELLRLADGLELGADTTWFFDQALAAKQQAQAQRASQRTLAIADLDESSWREALLAIGRRGDHIIAISDELVATIAE